MANPSSGAWAALAACLTMATLAAAPATAAKIVCWTNKDGVRECGNAVPPEYAQQSTVRKSSQGITVERTQRALTAEELATQRAEQARLEAEAAEAEQRERERAQYDRVLLATFTTEEDLKLTRDGKLAAINSRIRHTEQVGKKLEESLGELQDEAARLERGGKQVPAELQKQIQDVQTQIDESREEILLREREKTKIEQQFELDLARYRELKGTTQSN